jgi:hypothetical protein
MSMTAITGSQSRYVDYPRPYRDATVALIVPDHRRKEFSDRNGLIRCAKRQRPVFGAHLALRA